MIDASNIMVAVDDKEVKLSGTVPTYTAKQAATEDTWAVNGVKLLSNKLAIKYPETIPSLTDETIHANVKSMLLWNTDLTSYQMDITVEDGRVTLEGTVDSYWQKIQAEDEVWSIFGVVEVINKLAVIPSEDITDEIIGQEVIDAIDRNNTVDVDDITVSVDEGMVTLTGLVPTHAARAAAYDAALYTWGVTNVDTKIIVDYAA